MPPKSLHASFSEALLWRRDFFQKTRRQRAGELQGRLDPARSPPPNTNALLPSTCISAYVSNAAEADIYQSQCDVGFRPKAVPSKGWSLQLLKSRPMFTSLLSTPRNFQDRLEFELFESAIEVALQQSEIVSTTEPDWCAQVQGEMGQAVYFKRTDDLAIWMLLTPERASQGCWKKLGRL